MNPTPAYNQTGIQQSPIHQQHAQGWLHFNRMLARDAGSLINEAIIESRLDAFLQMKSADPRVSCLTLARITELAIIQAGDYADNCEFQAAGDLLVNPRRIDVYRRGWKKPVIKDRHRPLSDQFAAAIGRENTVGWLKRETITRIREEALLPYFKQMLSASGLITPEYLTDLDRRMYQVADTVAFLMSWQITDSAQFYRRLKGETPESEAFILSRLCRFNDHLFNDMGVDIENMMMQRGCSRQFLICSAN